MRAAALLALLLAAVLAGCGSSKTAKDAVAPSDLAQAAAGASKIGTTRFSMELHTGAGGKNYAITGGGVMDVRHRRGRITLDMSDLAAQLGQDPSGFRGEEILDGLVVYMRLPFLSRLVHAPWVKLDLQKLGKATGIDLSQFTQFDPSQILAYLKTISGGVKKVGTEQVRGVDTTHYHATADFDRYPDAFPPDRRDAVRRSIKKIETLTGAKTFPMDVWIDSAHRVRRVHFAYPLKPSVGAAAGTSQPFSMTMEFFGFGTPVHVTPPPASQTKDFSELSGLGAGA